MSNCDGCGASLPPSNGPRSRRWCGDTCRKRDSRDRRPIPGSRLTPPSDTTDAVRAALDAAAELPSPVEAALASMALSMARVVDAGGAPAVSACRELRSVLADLASRLDADTAAFLLSVQTPLAGLRTRNSGPR